MSDRQDDRGRGSPAASAPTLPGSLRSGDEHENRPGDGSGPAAGTSRTIPVREGASACSSRLLLRFGPGRRRDLRPRPDHRPRQVRKRKKAPSRKFRGAYGHTPLSAEEDIPWRCRRLVIGTGAEGTLPVLQQVRDEARRRKIDLIILPTAQAIGMLTQTTKDTNAILHLTC